ncbi:hypothetical protein JW721_04545 [Candidatus Micrarchaeota archaeon]|nr:hypothetical protein [Candidatus Micrarchaeota archaeon]
MAKKSEKGKNEARASTAPKAAAGTILIVALSIGIFLAADALFPFRGLGDRREVMELMQSFFTITTILSSAMFLVSVYLLYIYLKDYLELRSGFTLGILLAVASFLLFSITSNPILHMVFGIFGKEGIFSIIPMIFATLSLIILAWVSSR